MPDRDERVEMLIKDYNLEELSLKSSSEKARVGLSDLLAVKSNYTAEDLSR
jgi:hypothetical protein